MANAKTPPVMMPVRASGKVISQKASRSLAPRLDAASPSDRSSPATLAVEAAHKGARLVAFGHLGDGNIHFNVSQPEGADKTAFLAHWDSISTLVHRLAHDMGGTISAEHGLGRMKKHEIAHFKSPLELELMARVKSVFDPFDMMNPGVVLDLPFHSE